MSYLKGNLRGRSRFPEEPRPQGLVEAIRYGTRGRLSALRGTMMEVGPIALHC